MANTPQKTKDATEEALTAIQEALGVRPAETRPGPSLVPRTPASHRYTTARRRATSSRTRDRKVVGRRTMPRRAAPPMTTGSVSARSCKRCATVRHAVALSCRRRCRIHLGCRLHCRALFHRHASRVRNGEARLCRHACDWRGDHRARRLFLRARLMFNRAQDMRVVAKSMAEVAMRLAQPETVARESIVTVGQAIRREVAAMGDGVERALARAAELEALVHNEVSALERAYNDNEVRIRDLLTELTNQRETLVNKTEQVRNAIASVHLDLAHDITSVGDLVADKVNEVAQRVTRSLTEKGEHITLALGHAGNSMIDALSERGSTLLDRLETTSDQATTAISSASDRLSTSLNFKTEHVHDEFADLARPPAADDDRTPRPGHAGFSEKSSITIDSMASRSQQLTEAITDTSNRLAEWIASRAEGSTRRCVPPALPSSSTFRCAVAT